jgi:hypothetical protein
MAGIKSVSASTSRDSLPLAVAVVVPKDDQDALRHYPANGNNAGVAQEVSPGRSTATKGCAALVAVVVVVVASVMLVFTGSPDTPSSEPFTANPIPWLRGQPGGVLAGTGRKACDELGLRRTSRDNFNRAREVYGTDQPSVSGRGMGADGTNHHWVCALRWFPLSHCLYAYPYFVSNNHLAWYCVFATMYVCCCYRLLSEQLTGTIPSQLGLLTNLEYL